MKHRSKGFALVVVLASLIFLSAIILAFLSSAGAERQSAQNFASAASVKQLSDTAVNLVMAQIKAATKGYDGTTPTAPGNPVAWASQPGMIRTFSNSPNGPLTGAYKLYSADKLFLNAPNSAELDAEFAIPTTWVADTAVWTDLNEPISPDGVNTYPILDPNAEGTVEGFTINAPPGGTKGQMPVKWLYTLRDGTLVAPTGNGATATVSGADPSNPITGRIAFWTDDETSKVNINTASEGTFWDTPRLDSAQERAFAKNQPAQGEFQTYPGHPASTSLAPIFFAGSATSTPILSPAQRDAIYNLVPRISGGGSNGGTQVSTTAVSTDSDRLYATVDELLYSQNPSEDKRSKAVSAAVGVTPERLKQVRFFLTANSRAPEVTLFNTPRISMWPLDKNDSTDFRTAFDRLIGFCSTVGSQPYYFTRTNPKSSTDDYGTIPRNQDLYGYLQKLTSQNIPGFGGNFSSKLGADRDQVLTQIFDYIRCTNLNDLGITDRKNRYAKRAEITLNATDDRPGIGFGQVAPIRIAANNTQGFGRFPTVTEVGIHFICTARADNPATLDNPATPVVENDESAGSNVAANKTLGTPPTLLTGNQRRIEAMVFYETFIPSMSNPPIEEAYSVRILGLNGFQVNTTPLQFPADATDLSFVNRAQAIHGRDYGGTFSHRGVLQGNPDQRTVSSRLPARGVMPADAGAIPRTLYPFVSIPITIDATAGTMTFKGGAITVEIYPRTLDTAPGYPGGTQPIQTLTMTFPDGTFPIPDIVTAGTPASGIYGVAYTKENWWTFSLDGAIPGSEGRIRAWSRTPSPFSAGWNGSQILSGDPFHPNDVVRSMVPAQNDYRLLSLNLPAGVVPTQFVRHPFYDDATKNFAHAVSENNYASNIRGRTVQPEGYAGAANGVTYSTLPTAAGVRSLPDVPIASPASGITGDWDNGIGFFVDGPYINRADEGNIFNINDPTRIPYFDDSEKTTAVNQTFFSPNRQIPSAGVLGSLPSQPKAGREFLTLLFRPQPGHFGATTSPRDHLLTDLFWMPVVEPYAISEPFSTAGKINMNYSIAPFGSFITRSTGIVALLRSEKILAIPNANAAAYKYGATITPSAFTYQYRQPIDAHETLTQFGDKFAKNEVFVSPSQIMELHLVPKGRKVAEMPNFWAGNRLTGDNSKEKPYANLLGRLTTKSNTFTVHFRVQKLKKVGTGASVNQGIWDNSKDKVEAEYRGSTLIERYLDMNDSKDPIPDYGSAPNPLTAKPLGEFYKFRVISTKQFTQ